MLVPRSALSWSEPHLPTEASAYEPMGYIRFVPEISAAVSIKPWLAYVVITRVFDPHCLPYQACVLALDLRSITCFIGSLVGDFGAFCGEILKGF